MPSRIETPFESSGSDQGQPPWHVHQECDRFPLMARIGRMSAGFGLIIAGGFMLVLPGPGIITIVGGLALLSKDVAWAGRLADNVRGRFDSVFNRESTAPENNEI